MHKLFQKIISTEIETQNHLYVIKEYTSFDLSRIQRLEEALWSFLGGEYAIVSDIKINFVYLRFISKQHVFFNNSDILLYI